MLKGSCSCGAVHFEVADAFVYAFYCHCAGCRRRTGSVCAAIGAIEADRLRITRGDVLRVGEHEDGYRCLCARCFSPLYDRVRQRKFAHVQLGALSDAPAKPPDHHIHVRSKATWHEITDALPQFEEFPPG